MSKKVKILFAINCMNIGGAPMVVLEQSKAMDKNRFDVHLATLYKSRKNNFLNKLDYLSAGRFIELGLNKKFIFFNLINWYKIFRFLKKEKFDVVYTHLFVTNCMVRFMAIVNRVPLIYSFEHSFYNNKSFVSRLVDKILSIFTERIIVPSEDIAQYTSLSEKINLNKFFILPNPISIPPLMEDDFNKFKNELGLPLDSFVVMTLGRFSKEKNQELFIEIAEKTSRKLRNIYFLLIGYGPQEKYLRQEIENRHLGNICKIIIDPERAKNFLYIGDVFVSTSSREGQPLAILEAMKANLPVIAFSNPGVESLVKNNINGLLVPFGNVGLFVDQLVYLYEKENIRKQLSRDALNDLKKFDISVNIKKFENLITNNVCAK